jgi:aspartate/tyrosine/aromatic aminotransferase
MISVFEDAESVPEDAAFSINRRAKADGHPDAVMLSVWNYRDDNGQPWTLPVVAKVKSLISDDFCNISSTRKIRSCALRSRSRETLVVILNASAPSCQDQQLRVSAEVEGLA